jgi:hypothetical protein
MRYVNFVLNSLCDLLLLPFRGGGPWPGLLAVACVTALLFVWAMRVLSVQRALKRHEGRLFGRALELLLFRHDMVVSLTALGRMAAANARYLKELLKPLAVMSVPAVLMLIQLAGWYDHRPFAVGEPVLVSVEFTDAFPVMQEHVALLPSAGLELETEALRIPALKEMNWRLRASGPAHAWVDVQTGAGSLRKQVVIGNGLYRISDRRVRAGFWNELLHPGEPPITRESPVELIRVNSPRRPIEVAGVDLPWWLAFLALTMIFGLVFGRVMRVSF